MTLLMLSVLLSLGTWQLRRLHWKEGILAQIAAAEAAQPVPMPAAPGPFEKVSVTGRFLPGLAAFYGVEVRDTPSGPVMGRQLVMPLVVGGRVILVDRGWVPGTDIVAPPVGLVTITGFARVPEHPRLLGAGDNPTRHEFFTLDPAAIAASLGLSHAAPFTLVALGPIGEPPIPAQHLPQPPNNHLSYALTWYGLAAALVVVFIAWARGRLSDERL
jgi:surfeit locus 1 family protein